MKHPGRANLHRSFEGCSSRKSDGGPGVSRRDFLRLGAAASCGIVTGSLWLPALLRAAPNDTSRVVIVTDDQVLMGSAIDPGVVRVMVDSGIKALTDASTPAESWLSIFPDLGVDLSVGIKINTINSYLSSHPEVAVPIAESLAATPLGSSNYPLNQIVIWDRYEWELLDAGYTINTSTTGVRCFGTDHAGIGYNPSSINVNGSTQHVSRCYTDYSDFLINLGCLKNHTISGTSSTLKNHYGSVQWPWNLHGGNCDPFVPALNSALISTYGARQKLCICDAIFGIYSGGPMGYPQFAYKGIILSQDSVALDVVCRSILEDYGCSTIPLAHHIDTAAGPPYNLGISDPAYIEIVEIVNPSLGVASGRNGRQPGGISLGQNYPEPFNAGTTIPVILDKPSDLLLVVYAANGQRIRRLFRGKLLPGTHAFPWNGRNDRGHPLTSGRYIVRLSIEKKTYTREITLLR